jgi:hypothetical protein
MQTDMSENGPRFVGERPRRRSGPVVAVAALLLAFGVLLTRLGEGLTTAGQLWAGDTTLSHWRRAVAYFRFGKPKNPRTPDWERRLMHVGPTVILSIGAVMALLVTLLLVGGALLWVILNGYGLWLMLGAVIFGGVVGLARARLSPVAIRIDRRN